MCTPHHTTLTLHSNYRKCIYVYCNSDEEPRTSAKKNSEVTRCLDFSASERAKCRKILLDHFENHSRLLAFKSFGRVCCARLCTLHSLTHFACPPVFSHNSSDAFQVAHSFGCISVISGCRRANVVVCVCKSAAHVVQETIYLKHLNIWRRSSKSFQIHKVFFLFGLLAKTRENVRFKWMNMSISEHTRT